MRLLRYDWSSSSCTAFGAEKSTMPAASAPEFGWQMSSPGKMTQTGEEPNRLFSAFFGLDRYPGCATTLSHVLWRRNDECESPVPQDDEVSRGDEW